MVRARHQHTTIHLIDLYLLLSFGVALMLWFGMWLTRPDFLPHSFFLSTFVAINFFGFSHGLGLGQALAESKTFGGLLLTQFALLIGAALEYDSTALVFMAVLPCLAACYAMLAGERNLKGGVFAKDLIPPLVGVGCYLGFVAVYRGLEWRTIDLLALSGFVFWTLGTLYWGSVMLKREHKSLIGSLLRRSRHEKGRWRLEEQQKRDERLFFHDVINHTHGLNLFLQQKVSANDVIVAEEIGALMGEVKALQSLVADHFGYKHKNLLSTLEWVEIDYAMASFHRLVHTLIPSDVEIRFEQSGLLDRARHDRSRLEFEIHYPTFLRVCTNLVKNIAEQRPRVADFSFEAHAHALCMRFKNKMGRLHETSRDLEHALSYTILAADHSDHEREQLGLESVQVLCAEHGGHFDFAIDNGEWVAQVELPMRPLAAKEALTSDKSKKVA